MNSSNPQYSHPNWRKKSQEIRYRDSFECQNCQNQKLLIGCDIKIIEELLRIRLALELFNSSDDRFWKYNYGFKIKGNNSRIEIQSPWKKETVGDLRIFNGNRAYFKDGVIIAIPFPLLHKEKWFYIYEGLLHVHHKTYYPNRDLWDYDDDDLVTLCEYCHNEIHQ